MCKCCDSIEFWKKVKREDFEKGIVESKLFARISVYSWRKRNKKNKTKRRWGNRF